MKYVLGILLLASTALAQTSDRLPADFYYDRTGIESKIIPAPKPVTWCQCGCSLELTGITTTEDYAVGTTMIWQDGTSVTVKQEPWAMETVTCPYCGTPFEVYVTGNGTDKRYACDTESGERASSVEEFADGLGGHPFITIESVEGNLRTCEVAYQRAFRALLGGQAKFILPKAETGRALGR